MRNANAVPDECEGDCDDNGGMDCRGQRDTGRPEPQRDSGFVRDCDADGTTDLAAGPFAFVWSRRRRRRRFANTCPSMERRRRSDARFSSRAGPDYYAGSARPGDEPQRSSRGGVHCARSSATGRAVGRRAEHAGGDGGALGQPAGGEPGNERVLEYTSRAVFSWRSSAGDGGWCRRLAWRLPAGNQP